MANYFDRYDEPAPSSRGADDWITPAAPSSGGVDDWVTPSRSANYFDQYDPPQARATPPRNHFDQYDPPAAPPNHFDRYDSPQSRAGPVDDWVAPAAADRAAPVDDWIAPEKTGPGPKAEGQLATGARELAHGLLPAAGLGAGAVAGAELGSVLGLPGIIGGGLIGGLAGHFATRTVQEEGLKALGADDSVQMAINAKTNPWSAAAGSALSTVGGFGAGAAPLAARAAYGALGGGIEGLQQLYQGEFDPARLAGSTVAGAVFAKPSGLSERLGAKGAALGEQLGERFRPQVEPKVESHGPAGSPTDSSASYQPPPPTTAESQLGDPHNKVTRSERSYPAEGTEPAPAPGGGVSVGSMDPTLRSALEAKFPPPAAAEAQARPFETAEEMRRPPMTVPAEDARVTPEMAAPATPREAIEQRAPGETVGGTLREMAASRRQDVLRGPEPGGVGADTVRFYHGGEDPTSGGPRWLTPDENYARNFRADEGQPNQVHYVDIPRARLRGDLAAGFDDINNVTRHFEAPEDIAQQLKPLEGMPTPAAAEKPVAAAAKPAIPTNVGEAARQGGGGGTREPPGGPPGTPPPGAPPPGAGQPDLAHTPPQQRGYLSELLRDVQRKVAAHTLGPEGMEARRLIRGSYGETQRIAEQTADLLNRHQDTIRATPEADRWAMINQMQGGDKFPNFKPTAEQQAFMKDFERTSQEWEAKLRTLDATDQMNFRDHYMAQMYENPQTAPSMDVGFGKRGGAGSTKGRKYDTYEDAKAAGLTPKTSDPIEIGVRYANSIKDFVASRQVMERAEAAGNVGYFAPPKVVGAAGSPEPLVQGGPPPGWKKLNTPGKNGKVAYAPEDFADTFNNFYDKGLAGRNQPLFETLRNSTNAWTQLELGLNAYHAFTMANEAVISDVAKGLTKALSGDVRGGFRDIGKAPGAFITRAIEGKRFQQEYLDPNSTNPIASILAEANARPIGRGHAADYTFQDRGSFINKFSSHNLMSEFKQAGKDIQADWAKADTAGQKALFPLRQAGRVLQTAGAPIFDKYIPMLKAGAVHSQMKDWHEAMVRKNPNFDMTNNPADRRAAVDAAMKIVDSVDNRFGEMIHDNMFMNATLKQSAQLAMRSFSWAIGAMKEIGGGTYATGRALGKLAMTGENRFSSTHPEWDPRMSYAIAFPFVLGTVSSIYQFLRDGEAPTGWRDIYAPRTGGTVPGVGGRGQVPEHVLMPGYQKDVLGWIHHPLQEVYNKLGGLPTTAIEQATGRDWKGEPIVKPGASLPEAAGQRMAHLFSKLSPISVKNMTKGTEPTSNISRLETGLGFRAPGSFIQDPEGLERALKFKGNREWKAKERKDRRTELRQSGGAP
jgi:hypothetical protein